MAIDLHNTPNQIYPVQLFIYQAFERLLKTPEGKELSQKLKEDGAQAALMGMLYELMSQARLEGFKEYFHQYNQRVMGIRAEDEQQDRDETTDESIESLQDMQRDISDDQTKASEEAVEEVVSQDELRNVFNINMPLMIALIQKSAHEKAQFIKNFAKLDGGRAMLKTYLKVETEALDAILNDDAKLGQCYDELFLTSNLVFTQRSIQTPKPAFVPTNTWAENLANACLVKELLNLGNVSVKTPTPLSLEPVFSSAQGSSKETPVENDESRSYITRIFETFNQNVLQSSTIQETFIKEFNKPLKSLLNDLDQLYSGEFTSAGMSNRA